jgi:lipopolysaccharide biosynthesis protein
MNVQLQVPYATVVNRQNIGWDFGGWSDCLLTDDMYKKYDSFIFANSTIMGPFLPPGFSGKWTDAFIGGLNANVKLFGSTINTMRRPATNAHVQSYIFSADREAVEYLIQCEIFSKTKYAVDFRDAVFNKEIAMSRRIVENGWNIGSLMKHYEGVDFTKAPTGYDIKFLDDVMYPEWHNIAWTEHEIIFIKGNRVLLNPTRRAPELG